MNRNMTDQDATVKARTARACSAILIAGPTASGKSSAALRIAQALNGVVINADSMQVYRDLRILTARPSPQEEAAAEHMLYGHVDAARRYSAGAWLRDAERALHNIRSQDRLPIFTGGTGLYFRALEQGLADIPDIPGHIRAEVAEIAARGPDALLAAARKAGLESPPQDKQRLIRALEVVLATGRPLSAYHGSERPLLGPEEPLLRIFIAPEREYLRNIIAQRFHDMLRRGAIEEVKRLLARRLDPDLPAMKAHGVRNIAAALRGEITMDEAAAGAIAETRQYAKRQMTWARKYMRDWHWVPDPDTAVRLALDRLQTAHKTGNA